MFLSTHYIEFFFKHRVLNKKIYDYNFRILLAVAWCMCVAVLRHLLLLP